MNREQSNFVTIYSFVNDALGFSDVYPAIVENGVTKTFQVILDELFKPIFDLLPYSTWINFLERQKFLNQDSESPLSVISINTNRTLLKKTYGDYLKKHWNHLVTIEYTIQKLQTSGNLPIIALMFVEQFQTCLLALDALESLVVSAANNSKNKAIQDQVGFLAYLRTNFRELLNYDSFMQKFKEGKPSWEESKEFAKFDSWREEWDPTDETFDGLLHFEREIYSKLHPQPIKVPTLAEFVKSYSKAEQFSQEISLTPEKEQEGQVFDEDIPLIRTEEQVVIKKIPGRVGILTKEQFFEESKTTLDFLPAAKEFAKAFLSDFWEGVINSSDADIRFLDFATFMFYMFEWIEQYSENKSTAEGFKQMEFFQRYQFLQFLFPGNIQILVKHFQAADDLILLKDLFGKELLVNPFWKSAFSEESYQDMLAIMNLVFESAPQYTKYRNFLLNFVLGPEAKSYLGATITYEKCKVFAIDTPCGINFYKRFDHLLEKQPLNGLLTTSLLQLRSWAASTYGKTVEELKRNSAGKVVEKDTIAIDKATTLFTFLRSHLKQFDDSNTEFKTDIYATAEKFWQQLTLIFEAQDFKPFVLDFQKESETKKIDRVLKYFDWDHHTVHNPDNINEISIPWLQRKLEYYLGDDAPDASYIYDLLEADDRVREQLEGIETNDVQRKNAAVKFLLDNRLRIVYGIKLFDTKGSERQQLLDSLKANPDLETLADEFEIDQELKFIGSTEDSDVYRSLGLQDFDGYFPQPTELFTETLEEGIDFDFYRNLFTSKSGSFKKRASSKEDDDINIITIDGETTEDIRLVDESDDVNEPTEQLPSRQSENESLLQMEAMATEQQKQLSPDTTLAELRQALERAAEVRRRSQIETPPTSRDNSPITSRENSPIQKRKASRSNSPQRIISTDNSPIQQRKVSRSKSPIASKDEQSPSLQESQIKPPSALQVASTTLNLPIYVVDQKRNQTFRAVFEATILPNIIKQLGGKSSAGVDNLKAIFSIQNQTPEEAMEILAKDLTDRKIGNNLRNSIRSKLQEKFFDAMTKFSAAAFRIAESKCLSSDQFVNSTCQLLPENNRKMFLKNYEASEFASLLHSYQTQVLKMTPEQATPLLEKPVLNRYKAV